MKEAGGAPACHFCLAEGGGGLPQPRTCLRLSLTGAKPGLSGAQHLFCDDGPGPMP